jgi:hypothetical protein
MLMNTLRRFCAPALPLATFVGLAICSSEEESSALGTEAELDSVSS